MNDSERFAAMISGLEDGGLRRSAIARELHMSRMTVWRLAEGVSRQPAYDTINRLTTLALQRGVVVSPLLQKTG